jgi:putative salt-induced outer membrane protein YdiY
MKKALKIFVIMFMLGFVSSAAFAQQAEEPIWNKELTAGYTQSTGNTQNSQLNASVEAKRKRKEDEIDLKASTLYSSQNKKMDGQKHNASARYGFSLWEEGWYGFYKFAVDHDRFANIDYRMIPTAGIGYWFSDTAEWKAQAEVGFGIEHTNYRDNTKETTDAILVPRAFFEKAVFYTATLSQEIVLYPNLEDSEKYRIYAETRFTNPLSENMSLRCSFIDEFNSDPAGDSKKNDTKTVLSIVYSF